MSPATIIEAIGTFTVTNIDDIVVLAVFFGQAPAHRGAAIRVIAGQYLGFAAILAVSIAGAILGATLLPSAVLPYFGLLPILLGLRAAWVAWRDNRHAEPSHAEDAAPPSVPGIWQVAAVTFANGGDNIGVYVPIFAVATVSTIAIYVDGLPHRRSNLVPPADTSPLTGSSPRHSHAGATSSCPSHSSPSVPPSSSKAARSGSSRTSSTAVISNACVHSPLIWGTNDPLCPAVPQFMWQFSWGGVCHLMCGKSSLLSGHPGLVGVPGDRS